MYLLGQMLNIFEPNQSISSLAGKQKCSHKVSETAAGNIYERNIFPTILLYGVCNYVFQLVRSCVYIFSHSHSIYRYDVYAYSMHACIRVLKCPFLSHQEGESERERERTCFGECNFRN